MTKTIETKDVREARASARKIARQGVRTYQQALDDIARNRGFPHWAAFTAAHPGQAAETPENTETPALQSQKRRSFAQALRSAVAGQDELEVERQMSGIILAEETKSRTPLQSSLNQIATLSAMTTATVAVSLIVGAATSGGLPTHLGLSTVVGTAVGTATVAACIWGVCMAIGDQPGMERRRTQITSLLGWVNIVAWVYFVVGGTGLVDRYITDLLNITQSTALMLAFIIFAIGGYVTRSIHKLMVLGAAMGPRHGKGSIDEAPALPARLPVGEAVPIIDALPLRVDQILAKLKKPAMWLGLPAAAMLLAGSITCAVSFMGLQIGTIDIDLALRIGTMLCMPALVLAVIAASIGIAIVAMTSNGIFGYDDDHRWQAMRYAALREAKAIIR